MQPNATISFCQPSWSAGPQRAFRDLRRPSHRGGIALIAKRRFTGGLVRGEHEAADQPARNRRRKHQPIVRPGVRRAEVLRRGAREQREVPEKTHIVHQNK